jgi:queuine/archaeosine tRNA-ribosyltransferase
LASVEVTNRYNVVFSIILGSDIAMLFRQVAENRHPWEASKEERNA